MFFGITCEDFTLQPIGGRLISMVAAQKSVPWKVSMDFHTIRLLTPWDVSRCCDGEPEATLYRGKLPCRLQQPDSGWPICLKRRFNTPSGLSASTRVFLRVFWRAATLAVQLNGKALTACDLSLNSFRTANPEHSENQTGEIFEITGSLQSGNLIEIQMTGLTEPAVYEADVPRLPELAWVSLEIAEE